MFKRITNSYTISFLKYLLGLRECATSVTSSEHALLSKLAKDKSCIFEVGVFEGGTSRVFCQSMNDNGKLYLVDPYFKSVKIEKLLHFFCRIYCKDQPKAMERKS